MQPTDGFNVTRRALDIEDYTDILRRHKGWIFGPFLLTLVTSVVGAYLWPDSFESTALIQIKPQQISPSLVPVLSTQDILERISSLANQVKSRGQLSTMITSMNLYPREKNRMPLEDVLEIMDKAIQLIPTQSVVSNNGRSLPAFQIKFTYHNRFDANKVVQALTRRFIEQDGTTRSDSNYMTLELMTDQYDQKKTQLDEADAKMTSWKLANPGKLPEQYQSNLATIAALQNTQNSLQSQITNAGNEKLTLEGRIDLFNQRIANMRQETKAVAAQAPKPKNPKVLQAEAQLERTEQALRTTLRQFSAKHPNGIAMQREVDGAKQQLEEALKTAATEEANAPVEPAAPVNLANKREIESIDLTIQDYQNNIKMKDADIGRLNKQLQETMNTITSLNARVQTMPVGDAEFKDLARKQSLASEQFLAADAALNRVKLAEQVEVRRQGEKLDLLDSASMPVDPISPDRPLWISVGAGLGLVLGLVLAGAREMKDTSLKNLKDVRAYTQMAILGSVPLLENDFVVRRRRRIAWLGWTIACLVAVLVMAGAILYYYTITRVG